MVMPAQKPGRSKQDYRTPEVFIAAAKRRLGIGRFMHDFAADESNRQAHTYFTKADDALSIDDWTQWIDGGWGWLNPPFNNIRPWAWRCVETKSAGGSMALLVPAAVGANWYRDFVHHHALVLALNGRLCFMPDWATTIDPATVKPGKGPARCYQQAPLYPKDLILCLYGPYITAGFDVWNWRVPR